MIAFLQALPIGNAVKVLLAPPAGTIGVRVLRKTADTFTGRDDSAAANVYEGEESFFIDTATLVNGTVYYYRPYYFNGSSWSEGVSAHATPADTALLLGPDPLSLVRDRLDDGLLGDVEAGRISHPDQRISVLTAPPVEDEAQFPLVTVHLRNDSPEVRGVGEVLFGDDFDAESGVWESSEGWLSRITLDVIGWTINPDTRIALRAAMKRVMIGNLPVFSDAGLAEVAISFADMDDMDTYQAPVYTVNATVTALAPSIVTATDFPVAAVIVSAIAAQEAA